MSGSSLVKLARLLPRHGRLIYCLYRDPRTPRYWKWGLAVAVGLIVTPFVNVPELIPVAGELETIGLLVLAVEAAVRLAPTALREEHEAAITAQTSYFHRDLGRLLENAEDVRDRLIG